MSKSIRQKVKQVLIDKFGEKSGTLYERKIYEMCQKLREEYEDTLEAIYREFSFQKCGEFMKNDPKKVCDDIEACKVDWETCSFSKIQKELNEAKNVIVKMPEIKEGAIMCPHCKKKSCYSSQVQTRSGDEGMTTFFICMLCHWRKKI